MGMTGCGIDSREAAQRGDECRGETYVEPDDHDLDLLLGGHIANALAGVQVLFTVVDIDHSNSSACGRAKGTTKGIIKPNSQVFTLPTAQASYGSRRHTSAIYGRQPTPFSFTHSEPSFGSKYTTKKRPQGTESLKPLRQDRSLSCSVLALAFRSLRSIP
ncbi:hypothetical protein HPP92_025711 [Vanilla planifolia]|uniref:Uncharacterized protein n=1 Tax=Vanilla planifolia TaxID=51239 RepID=A0A835PQM4_VANPL|nr:hypothetical protein HPP92_025711 [Vanilla planifolia]